MKRYEALQALLLKLSEAKGSSLFFEKPPSYEALAVYMAGEIRPNMNAKEIESFIALIENIKIKNHPAGNTIGELIASQNRRLLGDLTRLKNSVQIPLTDYHAAMTSGEKEVTDLQKVRLSYHDENFINNLINIHEIFLVTLERNLIKANTSDFPGVISYTYTKEDLANTQVLKDLEVTTRKPPVVEQGDITFDMSRRSIFFHDQLLQISGGEVKNYLENFTGDKVNTPGSKAAAIYNFGGQYLYATLMDEFAQTTRLQGKDIAVAITQGRINWRKTENGEIFCDVITDVYQIIDYNNFYITDTDGSSLTRVSLNTPRGDHIITKELTDNTFPRSRVPIATLTATFKLTSDANNNTYFKAEKLATRYNVEDLTNTHVPTLDQREQPKPK